MNTEDQDRIEMNAISKFYQLKKKYEGTLGITSIRLGPKGYTIVGATSSHIGVTSLVELEDALQTIEAESTLTPHEYQLARIAFKDGFEISDNTFNGKDFSGQKAVDAHFDRWLAENGFRKPTTNIDDNN